ncbi:centrosome-associated protein 350 [Callorhinchus milii]|uniref:centrosome-associated protein 350 n=1 Tax=Callorhinchus milii TaxID=7868 RepID=UPI001C3FCFF5|nr:centrosome-associated protein 350 [Callorhinchus milii]
MWSSKSNEASLLNPGQTPSREVRQDLASAWDTVTKTKAALRHIENRLEAVPTSTAVLDSVMDTKKTSSSAARKVSRKDGRYLEDSAGSVPAVKSGSRSKSRREKSSRSPLRATTLESNIKKSSRVEFRDPLTSYRDLDTRVPPYLTASQLEAQRLLIDLNSNEVHGKEEESSRIMYERDKRNFHCLDDDSTRSSAVDDTVVKYLNDHSALDALHNSETLYKAVNRGTLGQKDADLGARGSCANPGYESDSKNDRPSEPSQLSSPSSTSESVMQKLEIMRKKQHDDKLEKLKERIRKQREQSEESAERERLLNFSEQTVGFSVDTATPTTKVRKVTAAPPAPTYKGFNPMETKIRTPDGKVWREDEFRSITRDLYRDFPLQLGESSKMKDTASDKTKEKKTTKPVRKVQKITRSLSPDVKPSAHIINPASWREGQKLVKMVLGPTPKVVKDSEGVSNERSGRDRNARAGHNTRAESDTRLEAAGTSRPRSSERPRPRQQPEVDHKKGEEPSAMDTVNTHVLPAEVRGILDDLQLEAPNHDREVTGRVEGVQNSSVSRPTSRSASPAKRKQDKGNPSTETQLKRLRHYDSEEVRQYIVRQQVERKKKQSEEKKAQKEAMEQRNKRLQELYRKQKEAFMRPRTEPMCQKRLQETFSKFVSEQAKLDELAHHQPALEDKQPRSIYQPSGESDKENKGQERPLSASSSSDMSLSEPPQPLGRVDVLESSWMPADRLSPAALSAHPHTGGNFFSHLLKLECRGLLQRECESPARRKEMSSKGKHPSLQFPTSTVLSDYATGSQKTTGQYKSKLDRIEALKATAASLANRLESEAKKLAGVAINYGAPHTSEHDVLQPAREDERWAKPVSPPVRDEGENEFSATMRRILGANVGHTIYDDRLPGVGNLYEYKKPLEQPRPQSAGVEGEPRTLGMDRRQGVSWEHTYKRSLEAVEQNIQKLSRERRHLNDSHNSSAGSISEGPIPSEASLSEDESAYTSRDPVKLAERLREREFCAGEVFPSRPIGEFQKEAEKYQPFQLQSEARKSRAPWEELAKGSPHSVINIFTKNYQIYGKGGLQEGSDRSSPILRPQGQAASPEEQATYEDDFHSSQGSTSVGKKLPSHQSSASSPSSIQEELLSRKSCDVRLGELSPRSSGQRSTSSSRSSASSKRRLKLDVGEEAVSVRYSPVDESSRTPAHLSDKCSQDGKRSCLGQGLDVDLEEIQDKERALDDASFHSMLRELGWNWPDLFYPVRGNDRGAMRCSPGSLQQRITAELTYLDAIEESVRQLTDIEKTRGIALAQQESVSLAQILKAQQQRHKHELAVLKLNAEQELLATQRHLEESRHKAAQAHVESLQHFAQTRQEMLHESTNKMMTQQTEAVRLTADAAHQIKEMTELACAQMGAGAGAMATASLRVAAAAPVTALLDQQRLQNSEFMKQLRARTEPDRRNDSSPPFGDKLLESKVQYSASIDSLSESSRSKHHNRSSGSSRQDSPSLPSDRGSERRASRQEEKGDSSVEEEVHTAADDSIQSGSVPSVPDDKDSVSVATEYSLKFDESMTEDEIEEKSFRSLLPSESHRRFNMERKRSRQVDSDEDATRDKSTLTAVKHELSMPFSGGQDSFSKFTMEMVRQYMKEEEMRAQHQVSLLKLREKALKEKTKAELAWLEHQRKRLRDKGEDDKMPPIRKRQRGLLLRLQQEQAEIKRLQEANKAARKERQLILKQQEEIQRMRQTTIKLQEKLKSAGEGKLELRSTEPMEEDSISKRSPTSSPFQTDMESRSPSPVSASGSETSSIMQKLKKMRSHMDEKHCSPVHCFFSVFTSHHWASLSVCFPNLHPKFQLYIYNQLVRFLTKREQKLMHRRRHAEELLEWKHRLDAEEAEIRRMEKQALAAWDKELLRQKTAKRESSERSPGSKDTASEEECPAPSSSHFNSDSSIPEEVTSPPAQSVESASVTQRKPSNHERSVFISEAYSQEFESVITPSTQSPPLKVSVTDSKQDGQKSSSSLSVEISPPGKARKPFGSWSDESVSMTYSETASDQSDIESRIRALKAELKKRKSIVDQLKKEQRKRQKERLKAQEASLLKQLESYDEFIKKTQAELSKDLDLSTSTKPQIKTPSSSAEKLKIKPHSLQRSESAKSWKSLTESEKSRASVGSATEQESRSSSVSSQRSNLHLSELRSVSLSKSGVSDIRTVESSQRPSPVSKSMRSGLEFAEGLDNVSLSLLQIGATECGRLPDVSSIRPEDGSGDESVVSSHRSGQEDIQEELQTIKSEESEADEFHVLSQQSNKSEPLLKLVDVSPDPFHTPELPETLTQRSPVSPEDKAQSRTVEHVEQNVGDLQEGDYSLGKEGSGDEEDGASDQSVSSVKSVKSSKSDVSAKSVKSDRSAVNKGTHRNDPHPQEVSALSTRKEPTYSEDFESTPRKEASEEHTNTCVGSSNSESLAAFSSRKEMGEHSVEPPVLFFHDQPKQEETSEKEGRCQSVSSSIDSDAEISEHLSEKSFSSSSHSERLWELRSPTERSKNEERSDVGTEDCVPVLSPSPEHTSTPMPFETDELPTFQIGDRVLVSSVQPGTLHFKGQTRFANGFWAGVELDKPEGSNNGMYDGVVYFTCKDKHGIFAPPHKISHLPEGYEELIDTTEDDEESLFESKLNQYLEAFSQEEEKPYLSKDETQQGVNEPKDSQTSEIPASKAGLKLTASSNDIQHTSIQFSDSNIIDLGHIINESAKAVESFVCDQNLEEILPETAPEDQLENLTKENFKPPDGSAEPASDLLTTDTVDNFLTKVSILSSNDAIREKEVSPAGHEVSSTPLMDLLTREKEQLEAQLRASHLGPASEEIFEESEKVQAEEEPEGNETKANSLADNLLSFFVKETVKQLQDIKKSRDGKIHLTNEKLDVELADESTPWAPAFHVEVQDAAALQLQSLVGMDDSDDDREEPLSPDLCARPGSPVFGTSGQEELAKRLAELEWSRELLDDLGDEQDWFDEDFGLSSRKVQQPEPSQQPLQPAEVQKTVPQKVRVEPYFAVPHNAEEVEKMVHVAAEELWKWQELGQDLQDMHIPGDYFVNCKGQDIESVSKRVYYEAMFNLTREIFSEIFAEDPNATQPPWMKSSRMSSAYFRRVRNLQDMDEVKTFISNEVLKLFGFRKEQNNKTDWQKMMKFGRKKRDRVDHILVQELHEEEAQWVNYDEDELCVKMQLADGIFEALIKDTIDVLNQIQEKRSKLVAS